MGPRADKHDDVYDRQIRLWGADAQVCVAYYSCRELSCFFLLQLLYNAHNIFHVCHCPAPSSHLKIEKNVQCACFVHQPNRRHV